MDFASAVRIAALRQAQYVANLCLVVRRLWHLFVNAPQNLLRNCAFLIARCRTDNNALHRSFSLYSGRETASEAASTDYQECTNELSINQILHLDKRICATVRNPLQSIRKSRIARAIRLHFRQSQWSVAVASQDFTFSHMIGGTDQSILFHPLDEGGGAVIADTEAALDIGGGALLVAHHHLDGLLIDIVAIFRAHGGCVENRRFLCCVFLFL